MSDPDDDDTLVLAPAGHFSETFFASSEADFPVEFGTASHVGHVRSRNEDHFAVVRFRRESEILQASLAPEVLGASQTYSHAMIVADGMGGMKAGELASRLALQTMLDLAGQASSWVMMLPGGLATFWSTVWAGRKKTSRPRFITLRQNQTTSCFFVRMGYQTW